MMDALENITKSSLFHKKEHFINDMPFFKVKDPQSFNYWLEQIDKVASLTNKDAYKLALSKSQESFCRTITSFLHSMGMTKIKEWLCYNFSSIATKQHVASMLIDQQQNQTKTLVM